MWKFWIVECGINCILDWKINVMKLIGDYIYIFVIIYMIYIYLCGEMYDCVVGFCWRDW